jgi:hypothetical protein
VSKRNISENWEQNAHLSLWNMSVIQTFPTAWICQTVSIALPTPSPQFSAVDFFLLGLSVLLSPSQYDDELQAEVVPVVATDGT